MDDTKHSWRILFSKQGVITDLLIITILWVLAVGLVNISGDFPLNDDWSYATTVKRLLEEKTIAPSDWTSAPIITHTLYGALFCSLFGFSFTVLRLSTIVLALLGVCGTYLLSRQLDGSRSFALLAALVLAFDPLYFCLSYSFMTDVPFTALVVFAAFFLVRNLLFSTGLDFVLGACFSVAAILNRQLGLCIPIAFVLATLFRHRSNRKWLPPAICLLVVGIVLLVGIEKWLEASGTLPAMYNVKTERLLLVLQHPMLTVRNIFFNTSEALVYLGFLLAPIAIQRLSTFDGLRVWLTALFFAAALSLGLIYFGKMMPLLGNYLNKSGLGPVTLRDTFILGLPHIQSIPSSVWMLITTVSIFGSSILLSCLLFATVNLWTNIKCCGIKWIGKDDGRTASFFLLSAAAIYFLPISLDEFFDRYLIPLVPLICGAIAPSTTPSKSSHGSLIRAGVALALASLLFFSVAGTRDYLAWNRTRWFLLRELMTEQRIPPTEIDGGFEFNGWYLFNRSYRFGPSKSWWWVSRDTYVLTMGEIEDYDVVSRRRFSRWLSPHEGSIFVLRRRIDSVTDP